MASGRFNYFDALVRMTDYACQVAESLDDIVKDFNTETLGKKVADLHEIEHAADELRHDIMHNLAREFMPPIDLADLVDLTSKLDDIVDCVDDVALHLFIYSVETLLPECAEFTALITRCCESVRVIAREFVHFRRSTTIMDAIIRTNQLESEGDHIYTRTMRSIFSGKMPELEVVRWARIISSLEDCCDRCEEASELFESVIMKNT